MSIHPINHKLSNTPQISRVKLSDFGFARTIQPESCLLKTHCGSLAYAAPEIVRGKDYDGRISDVWSL